MEGLNISILFFKDVKLFEASFSRFLARRFVICVVSSFVVSCCCRFTDVLSWLPKVYVVVSEKQLKDN